MTHFFYRQKRTLVRESPLLPIIHNEEVKAKKKQLLLLHNQSYDSTADTSTRSRIVKLPHELEDAYKDLHERRLYKRIFQNYEQQDEDNKKWDQISMPPIFYHPIIE